MQRYASLPIVDRKKTRTSGFRALLPACEIAGIAERMFLLKAGGGKEA